MCDTSLGGGSNLRFNKGIALTSEGMSSCRAFGMATELLEMIITEMFVLDVGGEIYKDLSAARSHTRLGLTKEA